MNLRFTPFTVLLLVALVISASAQRPRYTYIATGRVVDENRKPVPGVEVSLRSRHYSEGDLVESVGTDASGKFAIRKYSDRRILDWKIHVSDSRAVPENTDEL